MKYVGRNSRYYILWNCVLGLEKRKLTKKNEGLQFKNADAPVPANHPPFFCKLQKFARIGGKKLRQFIDFSAGDRLTINPRHDRSNFQGQYNLKIRPFNSDSYTSIGSTPLLLFDD
jgi:hypothetical protein